MVCKACNSNTRAFFSLGQMPLVNSFLKKEELESEKKYDLTAAFCPGCHLVQLTETVPPEKLFSRYLYFSSVSSSFLEHCKMSAEHLIKRLGLRKGSLVFEVASNDGAMLQFFKAAGVSILGVDPAKNIAAVANAKNIPTLPEFFNLKFAQKLKKEKGVKADLVYGANVLAHVPEIADFVKGVATILKPKGSAVFEFPYLKGLLEKKFDTIYHEHAFYYSLTALKNLFAKANLEIYDVEQITVQGGSLRIYAARTGTFPVSGNVRNLSREELEGGFDKFATYEAMGRGVETLKKELTRLLANLKMEGKSIAAYSAPAKGNVLLNYFGIKNYLDFIVDKSLAKQGLYTPGTHFLVRPVEEIYKQKPDYLLILCWNIADEVIEQLKDYKVRGGKFIIPIPEVKII